MQSQPCQLIGPRGGRHISSHSRNALFFHSLSTLCYDYLAIDKTTLGLTSCSTNVDQNSIEYPLLCYDGDNNVQNGSRQLAGSREVVRHCGFYALLVHCTLTIYGLFTLLVRPTQPATEISAETSAEA